MSHDGWPPRAEERIYTPKVFRVSVNELTPFVIVSKNVNIGCLIVLGEMEIITAVLVIVLTF